MNDFVDYYELLELSPSASLETIERVFRYFATKWHPDAGGDKDRFSTLIQAFETLKDPEGRAAYDAYYHKRQQREENIVKAASKTGHDTVDRHRLLCLFYAKRRQEPKKPNLGMSSVEHMMRCPAEVLEFHIWYFKEKGWIGRNENGGYSITAEGVDRIESAEVASANQKLIAVQRGSKGTPQGRPKQVPPKPQNTVA